MSVFLNQPCHKRHSKEMPWIRYDIGELERAGGTQENRLASKAD